MQAPNEQLPKALLCYLEMWNELDMQKMRPLLDQCIATDCLWVDPQNAHTGRDALENNVKAFRENFPQAVLSLASNVDGHHQRYRYDWKIHINGELLIKGFDVTTLNADGLIERVDGFFGELQAIE